MANLGESKRVNDFFDKLEKGLETTKSVKKEVMSLDEVIKKMADGPAEALKAIEKLGLLKNKIIDAKTAVLQAKLVWGDYSAEVTNASTSVEEYLKKNKGLKEEIQGNINKTDALLKAQEKKRKSDKKSGEQSKALAADLGKVEEKLKNIIKLINGANNTGLKVQIANADINKVFKDMATAIDRFHERAEGKSKSSSLFNTLIGSESERAKVKENLTKDIKGTAISAEAMISSAFGDDFQKTISTRIANAIKKGFSNAIDNEELKAQLTGNVGIMKALVEGLKITPLNRADLAKWIYSSMNGDQDVLLKQMEREKKLEANREVRIEKLKQQAKVESKKAKYSADWDELKKNPAEYDRAVKAIADQREAEAAVSKNKLQNQLNKEKTDAEARRRNAEEAIRLENELTNAYGEQGSKVRELSEKLISLAAKRREYEWQGTRGNKINFAEQFNNMREIVKKSREWAEEVYKAEHHYDRIDKISKGVKTVLTKMASISQAFSAGLSGINGIFTNMKSSINSFLGHFTNGFRRAFSYVRSLTTSALNSGLEQREKIEQAQIGFASFFGEDRVGTITQAVRQEAAKTPIVNAGDLADYVMQLAPVSQGNASLALNSSLGILKSLVYSGSDISEGEYVIKNIRDVIAKGTATAIDIRQFNRALPGLEQAIKAMPDLAEFVDANGKLSINKSNVGRVLDVFAKLNTDENSPLKDIEEKQLRTLDGMKQLFEEKKTTAMESILEKSGVFDLLYKVLGMATDDKLWNKLVKFVSNTLRPLVSKVSSILTTTDWDKLGSNISSFFKVVWEGVTYAKDTILTTVGDIFGISSVNDAINKSSEIFKKVAEVVKSFIKGFGDGASEAIKFVKWLVEKLSGGDINKLAEMVGKYLVSPLSTIIQKVLSIGSGGFTALRAVFSAMGTVVDSYAGLSKWTINLGAKGYGKYVSSALSKAGVENVGEIASQLAQAKNSKEINNILAANGLAGTTTASKIQSAGEYNAGFLSNIKSKVSQSSMYQKLSTSINSVVGKLQMFGAKLIKGISSAGIITLIGEAASTAIKGMNLFGDNSEAVANTISVASKTIAGAVLGGAIGNVAGGLIGAIAAAGIALVGLYNDWRDEHNKKIAEEKAVAHKDVTNTVAETIVKNMQEQGVNIDTGSNSGNYAIERMKSYLDTFDDPMMADFGEAEKTLLDALRFKKTAEGLADFAKSDEYEAIGGTAVDFKTDTATRDKLAELIKYYRLLGDSYEYGTSEQIVSDWESDGHKSTYEQITALENKRDSLSQELATSTTDFIGHIDNSTDTMKELVEAVKDNTKALNQHGASDNLIKNLAGWEQATDKSLYTTDGKTYHIADILQYINDEMRAYQEDFQSGLTDKEKKAEMSKLSTLYSRILRDYDNNEDFSPAKWFNYMHVMYGKNGFGSNFDDFYNRNGIQGGAEEYIKAYNDNGGTLLKDVLDWQATWQKLHPRLESENRVIIETDELKSVFDEYASDYSSAISLSEDEKKKIQDLSSEYSASAVKEFWELVKQGMSVNDAQLYIRENSGKSSNVFNPFSVITSMLGFNHGGLIKPIYRTTGGELGVDTVSAMLQPGEFVMRKSSVAKAGLSTMFALNRGDMAAAARSLGARFNGNYNNSRNWSNVTNNNQKTQTNYIKVLNRNTSSRLNSYYGLANRIALA